MAHNPECGLDCVSAGAVRRPSADANQQTGRHHLSGDQSAEQAKELRDLLMVAIGLIAIEARDHEEHYSPTREQRKAVAKNLRAFCDRARQALED